MSLIEDPDYEAQRLTLERIVTDQREHLVACMGPQIADLMRRQLIGVLAGQVNRIARGKQELADLANEIDFNEDFASW